MKLVFHGKYADVAGAAEITLPCPPGVATLEALLGWLAAHRPPLGAVAKGGNTATVINQVIVRDVRHPVRDGDEVAFLPPMSGG